MPPRTRKTAAAPPAEKPTVDVDAEEQAAPAPVEAASETQAELQAVIETLAAPAALTYRWESVNGDGSTPCRHCPPGAPPAGAGSYGCPHGQWVRVQDGTG